MLKEKEIRQLGEYRTRRLVLEAWDRMEADGTFADLGLMPGFTSGTAGHVAHGPALMELPPFESGPDGAWKWPENVQPRDLLRYAAQYALWQMNPVTDGQRIRFVIASLAEPAMLTPLLTAGDRAQWIRLVGAEAEPVMGVARLRPAVNAAWRAMFETLLTSGQLQEQADGAWAKGQDFSAAGLQATSADSQRTAFVIRAVRNMDIGALTAVVAQEDNLVWAKFGNG